MIPVSNIVERPLLGTAAEMTKSRNGSDGGGYSTIVVQHKDPTFKIHPGHWLTSP